MKKLTKDQWQLVIENDKLLYVMLSMFNYNKSEEEEIIYNAGLPAMIRAALRFDESKGFKFSTWACKIIYNAYNSYFKQESKKINTISFDIDCPEHHPAVMPDDSAEAQEFLKVDLKKRFKKLTLDQKRDIYLRFFKNMGYGEMSKELNISVQRCHQRVQKALELMRVED